MTLSQLRFAAAVARAGSFTTAAAECFATQPSLSNAVAQLEDELGEKLFVRTTRKVGLTPFGEQMLPEILRILRAQEDLEEKAKAFLSPPRPIIRIGVSPLLGTEFLSLLFEPFRDQHKALEIVLREMNMSELGQMLEAGQLDFVLGVAGSGEGKLESTFLYQEPLLYLQKGGPASRASGKAVRLAEIADETFVMVPDTCGLAKTVRSLFRSHRKTLKEYSGEAMSYRVLEQWTALGIGSAIVPESKLIGKRSGSARILDKKGAEVSISYEATWKKESEKIKHIKDFATYLKKVVPALGSGMAKGSRKLR
ncbi:LysR family transcriptional regulator [Luteolibacter luteus]|uniref:LysR family transcriptional regulator n=1 Tax=Luteolibacter luteus TaxID=2728835 RepID=A0A858RBD6_9BACT|nr:LysR family transcriptional regulator [Luteolibacter luteus]QJE94306.1 LysR family transcriptional regulator [Luteolibacter luteus]